jgi:hypothetical protein
MINSLSVDSLPRPRVKLLTALAIAHVLAGALVAFATYDPYDPYDRRDLSFILQEIRAGRVHEAKLIDDDQRISVTTNDGRQWYAHYGLPGLSPTALLEELNRSVSLGDLNRLTVEVSG